MKPQLGDVLADKYRLDRVLGEGGMSMVFAAVNTLTGKQVAIKWLLPEIVGNEEHSQHLLREAQATSSIDHPNVVNVFDIGRHGGALFLVMEHLHGEPLSELLARGRHDPVEFVQLMMPVLRGVHAAHRMGVVHRDLKPDNIFLCRDPHGEAREPKVLDFGISKIADNLREPGPELTRDGTVFGTPQYMAPEQLRDTQLADARSDIYALGVIFYRAFADQYPYDADTLTALAIRIVEGNAPPLHELCPHLELGLCDVVMRALALDPEQRFPSVTAFAEALEPYADGVLFAPPARDSWIALRDQHLSRDSQVPRMGQRSQRLSRPLPVASSSTRRTRPAPQVPVIVGHEAELGHGTEQESDEDPTLVDSRFTLPPHALVGPRPSQGIGVGEHVLPTQRLTARPTKRRNLLLGAALFTLGSVGPLAYQMLQVRRDPRAVAATAAVSTVVTSETAPLAHQPTAQPPKTHSPAVAAPEPPTSTPIREGIEPPTTSAFLSPEREQPSRRRARRRAEAAALLASTPEQTSDADAPDDPREKPEPHEKIESRDKSTTVEEPQKSELDSERNPYLRR